MFCDRNDLLDSFKFAKMCKDCNLLDRSFTSHIADIVFTQVLRESGTSRKIDIWGFEVALRLVAERKGVDVEDIWMSLVESDGPNKVFTKAQNVKYHDDISLYTGTHKLGGPSGGGGGYTNKSADTGLAMNNADLKVLGLRSA